MASRNRVRFRLTMLALLRVIWQLPTTLVRARLKLKSGGTLLVTSAAALLLATKFSLATVLIITLISQCHLSITRILTSTAM